MTPLIKPVIALVALVAVTHTASGQTARGRMLAAEDARIATVAGIAPLRQGLRSRDAAVAARAARGLGRFERPEFVRDLLPLLDDRRASVRSEVVNALGQSLAASAGTRTAPELAQVSTALVARLASESDPFVAGVIAETLGRLPYPNAEAVREVEAVLRAHVRARRDGALTGTLKGIAAIARRHQQQVPLAVDTIDALRLWATSRDAAGADLALARRLAWEALNTASAVDGPLLQQGLNDADAQVRRLAVRAIADVRAGEDERAALLERALRDPAFHVRSEAVRVYGQTAQSRDCAPVLDATSDDNPHVALAAADALATGCPAGPSPATLLATLADALPSAEPASASSTPLAWHVPVHALVSLAHVDRAQARARLPLFARHPMWQVRMYAARAAAELAEFASLGTLALDDSDNVRHEAVLGLQRVRGHDADVTFMGALGRRDYQLVLAAARALEGSPRRDLAAQALLTAFVRISGERRETSRDARLAILASVRGVGSERNAGVLQTCLRDIDPAVANACADVLQAWTGKRPATRPARRVTQPVAATLPARARIAMRGGGGFEVALFGDEAPATVSRFSRLAADGYYNGLTFHRVAPNFVIQGGSPGANEYVGDGPYMRDELGLRSHTRGTLGISTRGRDTGDAQVFVNLLDNVRLDHEYTVFAEVTSGMDVVDGILEGDVIESIVLVD